MIRVNAWGAVLLLLFVARGKPHIKEGVLLSEGALTFKLIHLARVVRKVGSAIN